MKLSSKFCLFLVPVLLTVALIWLPIGVYQLPQVEEWQVFSIFQSDAPVFWVNGVNFAAHRLRPLFLFMDAVAYSTPVPYLSMHALLAIALIVKGTAMGYIAYWLTRDQLISVIAAIVLIVHPADTMQMGFRSLVIIWPVALSVTAIALLLASTEVASYTKRMTLAVAAAGLTLIAGLMYEAALTMAVAPLILLFAKHGTRMFGLLASLWRQAAIWSAAIAANLIYIVVETSSGSTYQGALLAGAPPISDIPKYLVGTGLYRALLQGWYDGLSMFFANVGFVPYLLGAAAIGAWFFSRYRAAVPADRLPAKLGVRAMAAGIVLAALGYAPFLISTPHIYISQRTYLFASIGGAIFALGVLVLVKRSVVALAALTGLLVVSGIGSQWEQLAHYSELSGRQRMYLSGILAVAADAGQRPNQTLLITDKSGALSNTWMLRGENLAAALSYLYGKPIRAAACSGPGELYSSFSTDSYGTPGQCAATDKGWDIGKGAPNALEIPRANILQLIVDPDGSVTRPDGAIAPPDETQTKRAQAILGCFPCTYTPRETVTASYRFDFGKWWSLDAVPWGGGWADAAWIIPPAKPTSYSWMIAPTSNLFFRLNPTSSDYLVQVRIIGSISKQAKDTFAVAINGQNVGYTWLTPEILSGTVKSSVLSSGLNELRLEARPEKQFSVSNQIDWVTIAPAN